MKKLLLLLALIPSLASAAMFAAYPASGGATSQTFLVANATAGTQMAVPITQGDARYAPIGGALSAGVTITVPATGVGYTAPVKSTIWSVVGTVTAITITRGTATPWTTGVLAGPIPVSAGDVVTWTYTVAPTAFYLPN